MLPVAPMQRQLFRRSSSSVYALGEGMIGEGLIGEGSLEMIPSPTGMDGIVALTILVALGITVGISARFLEFGKSDAIEEYYLVRWISREARVVSIGSEALNSISGENSRRVSSLEEAKALLRLLRRQLPDASFSLYQVGSSLSPVSLTEAKGPVATDAQVVWDQELTARAEDEATAARTDVDEEWSRFSKQNLQLGRSLKDEVDVVIVGGDEDIQSADLILPSAQNPQDRDSASAQAVTRKAKCRLCNGKGYTARFNGAEEATCEWCQGTGFVAEDSNSV